MKRLIFIFTILLSLIAITSCENASVTKLKKEIRSADAVCPINYGLSGDLISIKYQENENRVLMYYSVNEDIAGYIFLKQNRDILMKQFRLTLSNHDSKQIVKDIVYAKASLMVIYKAPSTGKTIKLSLTYDELKDIKDNPLSDTEIKRMTIENSVAMQNAACPGRESDGMVQTKVAIVDDNIVYYIQLDEEYYDIKEMQKIPMNLKMVFGKN